MYNIDMPETVVFLASIPAVILGADWLGTSSSRLARKLSIPRILIGSTVISLVTTIPEITISIVSGIKGVPTIGLGASFGSPIVNIGLIFGLLLLLSNTVIPKAYFIRTLQIFLIVLVIIFFLALGGTLSRTVAIFLISGGFIYLLLESLIGKHEETIFGKIGDSFSRFGNLITDGASLIDLVYIFIGGILLYIGAYFLVESTIVMASLFNIPQILIAMVVVSFGTSIPETLTALNSIIRRRADLSVGNLFGASVLDLTLALGFVSIFKGISVDSTTLYTTTGTLAVLSSLSLLLAFGKISPRVIGALLVITYLIFIGFFTSVETIFA